MTLFWILLGLLGLTALLICYSALVVASRENEWEESKSEVSKICERLDLIDCNYCEKRFDCRARKRNGW